MEECQKDLLSLEKTIQNTEEFKLLKEEVKELENKTMNKSIYKELGKQFKSKKEKPTQHYSLRIKIGKLFRRIPKLIKNLFSMGIRVFVKAPINLVLNSGYFIKGIVIDKPIKVASGLMGYFVL